MVEEAEREAIQVMQQQQLKCPRCESTNTKFCYYNNYSLTQPRHFCKACKRYWTRGGTLRSVPVGGGCRKNKRVRRHPHLTSSTTPSKIASSNNTTTCEPSNTFTSHSLNPSGMGSSISGAHFINPMSYGGGFPFSDYGNHQHQLGLGFSSNGYSTRQILQDLISNSNPSSSFVPTFHGLESSNDPNTTSSATTMSMSSLLTTSLQNQPQQKLNYFPYESDLQVKGGLMYLKEGGMKMESAPQIQNGYEIHEHHHQQQQAMGGSEPSSILWDNNNTHGSRIGVNWLDPNYSTIGSSSVPSLI